MNRLAAMIGAMLLGWPHSGLTAQEISPPVSESLQAPVEEPTDLESRTDRTTDRIARLAPIFLEDEGFAGGQKPFGGDFAVAVGPDMGWTGPGANVRKLTLWPWASITKQVVATMIMQDVERGRISLDAPVISYLRLPPAGDVPPPTIRQLLQHRSGLRNPESTTVGDNGFPDFYNRAMSGSQRTAWCASARGEPPAQGFSYNNCDYILLGSVLEAVGGAPFQQLFDERIGGPAGLEGVVLWQPGMEKNWVADRKITVTEPIAGYGTSGALMGSTADLARFLRALVDGQLLGPEQRTQMWQGDPALGSMALGQWSFNAALDGCEQPVRIVERRGEIGRFQGRTFIIPDEEFFLAFVGYAPDFEFGEVWTGKGFAYRALSLAYCGGVE